ncbi:hypothetical protein Droror1_Dr00006348 [Drosera rotundifolia]
MCCRHGRCKKVGGSRGGFRRTRMAVPAPRRTRETEILDGEIGDQRVTVSMNWASVEYDVEENDAKVWGAVGVGKNVMISAEHHFRYGVLILLGQES